MALYRTYSDYLKEKYNEKVYKIPIALPVTCPNRDGTLDSDGCIFCGSIRADYETKAVGMEITRQIDRSISHVGPKYKAKKFIAYFLNFTNTYMPLSRFRYCVGEACGHPDIVGLAVSTRPDCIHESYLEALREAQGKYGTNITVELGLQSVNPHTLLKIGRCHTVAEFIDAALQIGRYHFDLCAHIIADLPWDDRIDVEEAAKLVSVLPVQKQAENKADNFGGFFVNQPEILVAGVFDISVWGFGCDWLSACAFCADTRFYFLADVPCIPF